MILCLISSLSKHLQWKISLPGCFLLSIQCRLSLAFVSKQVAIYWASEGVVDTGVLLMPTVQHKWLTPESGFEVNASACPKSGAERPGDGLGGSDVGGKKAEAVVRAADTVVGAVDTGVGGAEVDVGEVWWMVCSEPEWDELHIGLSATGGFLGTGGPCLTRRGLQEKMQRNSEIWQFKVNLMDSDIHTCLHKLNGKYGS